MIYNTRAYTCRFNLPYNFEIMIIAVRPLFIKQCVAYGTSFDVIAGNTARRLLYLNPVAGNVTLCGNYEFILGRTLFVGVK